MPRDGRLSIDYPSKATRRGWGVVAEFAADQHGVVALRQLVEAGLSPVTVRGWVGTRRLVRLHQGVFAAGHAALRREGHFLAAVLACGPGAVLSYRAAGVLWGIRRAGLSRIDVTAPVRTGRRKPGLRLHRGDRLQADEVTIEDAVPCTTVARTILDLAAVLDFRGLEAAVENAERRELFDLRSLSVLLARHRGRRGTARLRTVLAEFDSEVIRARTETEARCFHLCVDAGLPRPLVNRFVDAGDARFEVDLHWPNARLIVETDSPYHDTTAARRRDPRRDALLRRYGWIVIRCRWRDIVENPAPLIAKIRHHLGATGAFRSTTHRK